MSHPQIYHSGTTLSIVNKMHQCEVWLLHHHLQHIYLQVVTDHHPLQETLLLGEQLHPHHLQ